MASDGTVYDFEAETLGGERIGMDRYRGQVLLIVNTASKCGFTPQYAGLEGLYHRLSPEGFTVLGFPCNQFGGQEPGTAGEIADFCATNFGVSFPMMAKVEVNGPGAHPLYRFLKDAKRGLFRTRGIKWNFTKFLIDRQGSVAARYAPTVKPADLTGHIRKLL